MSSLPESDISRRTLMALALASGTVLLAPAVFADGGIATGRWSDTAIKGYDVTAYFRQAQARKGNKAHKIIWKDATWHFSNADAAELFEANPDAYAPQFGGYCTRAMSIGKVVRADPRIWRMRSDRLYMFASRKGQNLFDEDPDTMIAAAQAFWETL